ncbi:helix-turn-helix domain-containing protein [Paenibacillus oenotherae]|uniref:Helix-turn-helix domain-containing protein n=1 Tax=Paenibacillus oenotherae TaxID=1435645 RepID=A0ABS7DCF0_9BACL|nr:helix-turn-helix domain-containing protein [Paenibacillus oenotherae]MBW7477321.1 helix-turn-helix domain-containing protein [Paenibacillus oenotherae]
MEHWILVLIIILISGAIGGIVNYLLVERVGVLFLRDREFYKSIFIGLAAALLVPLFLNTISSNLIRDSETDIYKIFVISGFCLIASIYSKSFIQTLSDKVIRQLDEVQQKVKNVEKDVNAIADSETEDGSGGKHNDIMVSHSLDEHLPQLKASFRENDTDKIKILRSLAEGNYTFRSLQGMSKETGINEREINIAINELSALGYIDQSMRGSGIRFYITRPGREHLAWYNGTSYAHLLEKNGDIKGA